MYSMGMSLYVQYGNEPDVQEIATSLHNPSAKRDC